MAKKKTKSVKKSSKKVSRKQLKRVRGGGGIEAAKLKGFGEYGSLD